ncbi:hypothetical protein Tco_1359788 [Tanacetum coccineum]
MGPRRAIAEIPGLPIMPLYGDGDLITIKFIQAVVECSLLPTITGRMIFWKQCSYSMSADSPPSMYMRCVFLASAPLFIFPFLDVLHQALRLTMIAHLVVVFVGNLNASCLRVSPLRRSLSVGCIVRSPACPSYRDSYVATATRSLDCLQIRYMRRVKAVDTFGDAMDGTFFVYRLHDICSKDFQCPFLCVPRVRGGLLRTELTLLRRCADCPQRSRTWRTFYSRSALSKPAVG